MDEAAQVGSCQALHYLGINLLCLLIGLLFNEGHHVFDL